MKDTEILREALVKIATTFPTSLGMNGEAFASSAEFIKMRNNHMIIAQEALLAFDTAQEGR